MLRLLLYLPLTFDTRNSKFVSRAFGPTGHSRNEGSWNEVYRNRLRIVYLRMPSFNQLETRARRFFDVTKRLLSSDIKKFTLASAGEWSMSFSDRFLWEGESLEFKYWGIRFLMGLSHTFVHASRTAHAFAQDPTRIQFLHACSLEGLSYCSLINYVTYISCL